LNLGRCAQARFWAWLLASVILGAAPSVSAHMMPAQHGTLNIQGNSVFEVIAVPVSALHGADDNGDGRLSAIEVANHNAALQTQIRSRFRVVATKPTSVLSSSDKPRTFSGTLEFVQVVAEQDERRALAPRSTLQEDPGANYLIVLLKKRFAFAPQSLIVETDLFGTQANEDRLSIRATRGNEVHVGILRPTSVTHEFFPVPLQATAPTVDKLHLGFGFLLFLAISLMFSISRKLLRHRSSGISHPSE
jgi:hypothetical protein